MSKPSKKMDCYDSKVVVFAARQQDVGWGGLKKVLFLVYVFSPRREISRMKNARKKCQPGESGPQNCMQDDPSCRFKSTGAIGLDKN